MSETDKYKLILDYYSSALSLLKQQLYKFLATLVDTKSGQNNKDK